ncbi:MAG TPA: alpha-amylase family glycosyl hydrolase, partial [Phycisphaerae bacterium]|nr:alpha-amylase family glycosyl hydrolase [Phycisphaerae bacterium]
MDYIDQLIGAAGEHLGTVPRPVSTYRLQFHAGFTFADAAALSGYLRELGVTHAYASPYLKARAGSTHGYDVVDHGVLNPELGGREEYEAWVESLRANGLSHILDIVPNHMGVATNDNAWWNDVLRHGRASKYADYFDIHWKVPGRPDLDNKVLLPILGEPFGEVLEKGALSLGYEGGRIVLRYFERRLPVNLASLRGFFEAVAKQMHGVHAETASGTPAEPPEAGAFAVLLREAFPERDGTDETANQEICVPREGAAAGREQAMARELAGLYERSPLVQRAIQETLHSYNGRAGLPRSFDALDALLSQQHYRLAYWRAAAEKLNYRRFFDINDLAAIRMENEGAFRASHRLIFELIAAGKIGGLRVDHPDGLFDPAEYLRQVQVEVAAVHARRICDCDKPYAAVKWEEVEGPLRRRLRQRFMGKQAGGGGGVPPFPVVVEKILAPEESLPADWQADGTSGYDFLNKISG